VQTESELWKSSGYQDNVSQNYLAYSRQSGLSVSAGVAPRSGGSSKEFVSIEERRQVLSKNDFCFIIFAPVLVGIVLIYLDI
jgi:hypothetical protein